MVHVETLASFETQVTRLGVVLEPSGDPLEIEGILNPATARSRDGKLLVYPRVVARGNASRVGLVEASGAPDDPTFTRLGFALEPSEPYEIRTQRGGYGCEDPRVTFIPVLDAYVMCYTAYGPAGPRIAFARSSDGYAWERLGLTDFSAPGVPNGDDKDAAFFPEPVISPRGVPSLAFYHRPMLHVSAIDSCAAIPIIMGMPPRDRECMRIAYVPLEPVLRDQRKLLDVAESALVLEPGAKWGSIKNGGGTPPVRVAEGWLSFFHGVDGHYDDAGACKGMRYSAGLVVHDAMRPDIVRFRSSQPVFSPETADERRGVVNNVVFPTGVDRRPASGTRDLDVYYGMADSRIGRLQVHLGTSVVADANSEESAA